MAPDVEAGTGGEGMELAASDGGGFRPCRPVAVVAPAAKANTAAPVTTIL
jgi:hypothetical protein